jgi:uncharacterized protein
MNDFKQIQKSLATAIRDPEIDNDFEQRRIAIYQELIFNNIEGFCANAFPVLKSVTPDKKWAALVRGYMNDFKSDSPFFVDIAEQFLTYLTALSAETAEITEAATNQSPSQHWRNELAHYEWVELYISLQDGQQKRVDKLELDRQFSTDALVNINQSAWALAYQYPVHTITSENADVIEAQPTFLVVYQEPTNSEVQFLQTTGLVVHLLNLVEQHEELSVRYLIDVLTNEPFMQKPEHAEKFLRVALTDLRDKGVVNVS